MLRTVLMVFGVLDALGTLVGGIYLLVSWITGTHPAPELIEIWTGLQQFGLFLLSVGVVVAIVSLVIVVKSIRQPSYF